MSCPFRLLKLTDGTVDASGHRNEVNLLNDASGFCLTEWMPHVTEPKGGGVWADSSLTDGRQMKTRKMQNVIETFTLEVRNFETDALIRDTQELRRLLEKAVNYWTTSWATEPVWIEAVGMGETNMRYSLVMDYRTPEDGDPYGEPFWQRVARAGMDDFTLILEREPFWRHVAPGSSECVELSAVEEYCLVTPLLFDGNDDIVDCGSPAGLDDLPDFAVAGKGEIYIDGWIRADGYGATGDARIVDKTGGLLTGFYFAVDINVGLHGQTYNVGGDALSTVGLDEFTADGLWHHVVMAYDEAGVKLPLPRRIYMAVDGVWITSYVNQIASIGNYRSDAADDLAIGNQDVVGPTLGFDGDIGWMRISDSALQIPPFNFTPPARCPLPDPLVTTQGFYIWEGEGATTGNAGAAGGVGTITGAVWDRDNCCGISYGNYRRCNPSNGEFGGAIITVRSVVDCGSNAVLDDLPDFAVAGKGQITAEAWTRTDGYGASNNGYIMCKISPPNSNGWLFSVFNLWGLFAYVGCAVTNAISTSGLDEFTADGLWHHVVMTYDETGAGTPLARRIYLAIDGVWVTSYQQQVASAGNYSSEAVNNLLIGEDAGSTLTFDGGIGWVRVSDNIRYTVNTDFTPPERCTVPSTDANAMGIWNYSSPILWEEFSYSGAGQGAPTGVLEGCSCPLESDATLTAGRDPTCDEEVYIAGKRNIANITHAWTWSAANGFSANLVGVALPYPLIDVVGAAPAINDYVVFGIDTLLLDSGPFASLHSTGTAYGCVHRCL